jgi:hypothetical protein
MCQRIFCSEYVYIAETKHNHVARQATLHASVKLRGEYAKDA